MLIYCIRSISGTFGIHYVLLKLVLYNLLDIAISAAARTIPMIYPPLTKTAVEIHSSLARTTRTVSLIILSVLA